MNRVFLVILASLVLLENSLARDNSLLARVTVYWAHGGRGADHYTRQHKSSTGLRLQQGHCAVDPKRIPYGSRVVLPDGTALAAVDTGTAVRNRKAARRSGRSTYERNAIVIDKFFETKRQALAWANSNPPFVNVKVIPPGVAPVAKPNITNSQPIALSPATTTITMTKAASASSTGAITAAANASVATPTGVIVRNPLGRLGR
jgi:3D (Asp-Asp-Asp) domain-containing protein